MFKSIDVFLFQDQKVLYDVVFQVVLFVVGVDGIIDDFELVVSEKVVYVWFFDFYLEWMEFYEKLDQDFYEWLLVMIQDLLWEIEFWQVELVSWFFNVNVVFKKIDKWQAWYFYEGLLSFVGYVVKAFGGFIGWLSVGLKEVKVMDLFMIDLV